VLEVTHAQGKMTGSPIKDQTNVLNQSVGFLTVSFFSPQTFLPVVTNLGIRLGSIYNHEYGPIWALTPVSKTYI
jgi:hypothetical protein